MPSDPSGRNPAGVLVRPAPDFFDDNLAFGAAQLIILPSTPNIWFHIDLYNDRADGPVFKVYAVTSFCFGGGGLACFFRKGFVGTFQGECSSINPLLGSLGGQIYGEIQNANPSNVNPYLISSNYAIVGNSGFDSTTNLSTFPLFILPPGWSLACANINQSTGGAGFWYQVAHE